MEKIYPVDVKKVSSAIIEQLKNSDNLFDAQRTHFFDLEFIYNIEGFPENLCIFVVEDEKYYSMLSKKLIEAFGEGLGINHFPICWPGKIFKMISAEGDDITSLYFSNRERLLLSSVKIDLFHRDPLMLVKGYIRVPSSAGVYDSAAICKETIIDADEAIVFRATSDQETVYFTDNGFVIKDPVLPDLVIEYDPERSTIYYSSPYSKKLYCFLDRIEKTQSEMFFGLPMLSLFVSEASIKDSSGRVQELQTDQLLAVSLLEAPAETDIEALKEKICIEFYERRKKQLALMNHSIYKDVSSSKELSSQLNLLPA